MIERIDWRDKDIKWTDAIDKLNELIDFINKEFFSTPVCDGETGAEEVGNSGEDARRDAQDDRGGTATANREDQQGAES